MATKLSKEQKKYIDQAIRRLKKRFEEATELEREYAEKNRVKAPELKIPSKEEIYERIDTSVPNWSEQVKSMSSVEVYQPKAWGRLASLGTSAGVKSFDPDKAIKIMQASKEGYEKTKNPDKKYKPLRNVLKVTEDTVKKLKRSEEEEAAARRKTYLRNLQTKVESDLSGVSPELTKEITRKLKDLIKHNGEGSLSSLARARTEVLAESADESTKEKIENTIKALENLDLGDFTSGLAKIVGYDTFADNLIPLMVALGIDINRTYDGKSLLQIVDEMGAIENIIR